MPSMPKKQNLISKEEAAKALADARKMKVQKFIEVSTERSAEVLAEIQDSEDAPPVVRVAAAKDLLDRGGFKPVDRTITAIVFPKPILDLDAILKSE